MARSGRSQRDADIYCLGIVGGQDQGCTIALFRADGAEDVVGGGALIVGRSCPTSGHASNDKCSANISSLDNLGIKSPRSAIIRGRMNDT